MRCPMLLPLQLTLAIVVFLQPLEAAATTAMPYLNPGFEFIYYIPDQAIPIPVVSQCERIILSWSRTNNETGAPPVAPYFMQVYSSTSSVPYVVSAGFGPTFAWDVPFSPNTQFQICMFDINGSSGGCQTTYSVIANTTTTTPSCKTPTLPTALSVSAKVPNGAMFQNSQINQCETLSVTPQSGSPPYTLTVAPVSHPPFNITSKTMDPISWQVVLPVGFKFFLSLSSADGQVWANGLMNVGGLGGTGCFGPGMIDKALFEKAIIGSSIGGIVVGLVAALLGLLIFHKVQNRKRSPSQNYFAGRRLSRDNPAAPLKGTSTIGRSTSFGAFSSTPSSPTSTSIPLTPSTAVMHIPEVPPIPKELLTPLRRPPQRHYSAELPYTTNPPSQTGTVSSGYPADVKRPLPTPNDTDSVASSSMNSRSHSNRRVSTEPTYIPRPSQLRTPVAVPTRTSEEATTADQPPEYGRHTEDPHLKYAPSILSSGNRF